MRRLITKPSSCDLRRVLRSGAPPLLIFGALLAVGEVSDIDVRTTTFETSRLVTAVVAGAWLAVTTGMSVYRTGQDAHAHQRVQELVTPLKRLAERSFTLRQWHGVLEPANMP